MEAKAYPISGAEILNNTPAGLAFMVERHHEKLHENSQPLLGPLVERYLAGKPADFDIREMAVYYLGVDEDITHPALVAQMQANEKKIQILVLDRAQLVMLLTDGASRYPARPYAKIAARVAIPPDAGSWVVTICKGDSLKQMLPAAKDGA